MESSSNDTFNTDSSNVSCEFSILAISELLKDVPNLRRGRDIKTVANVWNPVLFCFTSVSPTFVYQLEAIIFICVMKLWE